MLIDFQTIRYLAPEGVLLLVGCLVALLGTSRQLSRLARPVALLGLIGSACALAALPAPNASPGPLLADGLAQLGRWLALVWAAVFVAGSSAERHEATAEYVASGLFGFLGLMVVSVASDLVLLFAGMELVSIASYIVLGLAGRRPGGLEGAVKYFVLSILSSAILLYGFSFLYGIAGSIDFASLDLWQATGDRTPLMSSLGLVLVLGGLTFKVAAVPFHFYAADVYEATSFSNAGLLAVLPKAVGAFAMLRLFLATHWWNDPFAWQLTLGLSLLTMTLGNVCALWQRNLRRLMAYSSVAHAGYILIGITVVLGAGGPGTGMMDGAWSVLFYVTAYGLASLGAIAGFAFIQGMRGRLETLDDLSGASTDYPAVSAAIAISMFSLAGIPPLGGFLGKLYLVKGALLHALGLPQADPFRFWLIVLTIVTVINAAVAATYYLRVVSALYFGTGDERVPVAAGGISGIGAVLASLLVLVIGIVPAPLTAWTQRAAEDLERQMADSGRSLAVVEDSPGSRQVVRGPEGAPWDDRP